MPIDASIPLQIQPEPPSNIMQTLAQIYSLREAKNRTALDQQRLALEQQQEQRLLAAARQKAEDAAQERAGQAAIVPAQLGQQSPDEVAKAIAAIPDPVQRHFAANALTEFRKADSEIVARVSGAGKADADTIRLQQQQFANLARSVRDVFNYSPDAIEGAFQIALTSRSVNPDVLKQYYQQWKENPDPNSGKQLIDSLISQGSDEYTLASNAQRMSAGNQVLATGVQPERVAPAAQFQDVVKVVTFPDGRSFTGTVGFNPQMNSYAPIGSTVAFPPGTKFTDAPPKVDPTLAALRDATLANMQRGGNFTPGQLATFQTITNQVERSPLVRAADRSIVLKNAAAEIKKDPSNAANQLQLAYAFVQAIDTYQTGVREGELANLGDIATRWEQLKTAAQRAYATGAVMPKEVALQIANTGDQLISVIEQGKQNKMRTFGAQAKVLGVGDMWDQYLSIINKPAETPAVGPPGTGATGAPLTNPANDPDFLDYQRNRRRP